MAASPGYDALIQAFSGLLSITGEPDGRPVRVGTSIIDMGTAMWAVIAILAALRHREETGKGALLTGSLLETGVAWLPYQLAGYLATGQEPSRLGTGLSSVVPYQSFQTADGELVVAAANARQWHQLCMVLERDDLAKDSRFISNPLRVEYRNVLVEELSRTFKTAGTDHWESALNRAGVPCSPVHTIGELLAHPQTRALEMLTSVDGRTSDDFQVLGLPFRIDGIRPVPAGPPPEMPIWDRTRPAAGGRS